MNCLKALIIIFFLGLIVCSSSFAYAEVGGDDVAVIANTFNSLGEDASIIPTLPGYVTGEITDESSDNITIVGGVMETPAENPGYDTTTLTELENTQVILTEYIEKIRLQREIESLDDRVNDLEDKNVELSEKQRNLNVKIDGMDNNIATLGKIEDDLILKAVIVLFFFSLAGLISSFLFINIVWRRKVRGIKK